MSHYNTRSKKRRAKSKTTATRATLDTVDHSLESRQAGLEDCKDPEFKELILQMYAESLWPTLSEAGYQCLLTYAKITESEIDNYFKHGFAITAQNLLEAVKDRISQKRKMEPDNSAIKRARNDPHCQCCHEVGMAIVRKHHNPDGGYNCEPCNNPNCSYVKGHKEQQLMWQKKLHETTQPIYSSAWVEKYHKDHGGEELIPPAGTCKRSEFRILNSMT